MTDVEKWAGILNGRTYRNEVTEAESEELAKLGLVAVFGASDDLMEFRGAIYDEGGCYNGGTVFIVGSELLESHADCDCKYCGFKELRAKAQKITAVWDSDGYSWTYKTEIPHKTFDILEDGAKYCRGIVFKLPD